MTTNNQHAAKGDMDGATRRVHGCTRAALRKALTQGLPRADALLLMLGYADGLTDEEIAEILGVTVDQVAGRRIRALRKVRTAVIGK